MHLLQLEGLCLALCVSDDNVSSSCSCDQIAPYLFKGMQHSVLFAAQKHLPKVESLNTIAQATSRECFHFEIDILLKPVMFQHAQDVMMQSACCSCQLTPYVCCKD